MSKPDPEDVDEDSPHKLVCTVDACNEEFNSYDDYHRHHRDEHIA